MSATEFFYDWAVAVFGANEAETIARCIRSIDDVSVGRRVHITILLNGTTDNSVNIIRDLRSKNVDVRVYTYPRPDKSNAINQFIYNLRPKAKIYFFIDAYTKVDFTAMENVAAGFILHPAAHIATGVPANGRSAGFTAAATSKGGVVNGGLYAITPEFLNLLVSHGFKLPLAIYRGDSLLGSMACHDLDAVANAWDSRRVCGIVEATFEISPLSIFRWRDIMRQFNREIRQARGRFENEAIKSIIYKTGYANLPAHADDMIIDFIATNKLPPRSLRERFFMRLALNRLRHTRKATATDLTPTLVHMSNKKLSTGVTTSDGN